MAAKISWTVAETWGEHQKFILHCFVEVAGTWSLLSHDTHVSYFCEIMCIDAGLVWQESFWHCDTSNSQMCYFPGRSAARHDWQKSIWDNQSGQKSTFQDQVSAWDGCLNHSWQLPSVICNHRELQRGVPSPYGEQFSKETLIKSASSKAFAATTEARIGEQTVMTWSTWHLLFCELFSAWLQVLTVILSEMASRPQA